jgi:hypothetical protein
VVHEKVTFSPIHAKSVLACRFVYPGIASLIKNHLLKISSCKNLAIAILTISNPDSKENNKYCGTNE